MADSMSAARGKAGKTWPIYGVLLAVVLGAGFLLPQMVPAPAPAVKTETAVGANPDKKNAYTAPAWPEPPNHQAMFLRLAGGTMVVLVLCVLTIWLCKRWVNPVGTPSGVNAQM